MKVWKVSEYQVNDKTKVPVVICGDVKGKDTVDLQVFLPVAVSDLPTEVTARFARELQKSEALKVRRYVKRKKAIAKEA